MQHNRKHGHRCGFLTGMGTVLILALGTATVSAQSSSFDLATPAQPGAPAKPRSAAASPIGQPAQPIKPRLAVASANPPVSAMAAITAQAAVNATAKPAAVSTATPYFVEFRSRHAMSYGHTYLVHGRVGQKITKKDVVGLHPATESPVPWMIGHLIPVMSETGASDGDAEEVYVSARYRVLLTTEEYARLKVFMGKLASGSVLWHAALYNCNAFVGDIANYVGLETPSRFLYPQEFITEIKRMNKGRIRVAADAPIYKVQP